MAGTFQGANSDFYLHGWGRMKNRKKLFLLIVVSLLIISTIFTITSSTPGKKPKPIDDKDKKEKDNKNNKDPGFWSDWSSYWVICHAKDMLHLSGGSEILQYPHYEWIIISDISVIADCVEYSWVNAVANNIVSKYIYIFTGGANFPEPAIRLVPFEYYIFFSNEECDLVFSEEG